jgi:hypothetical protein
MTASAPVRPPAPPSVAAALASDVELSLRRGRTAPALAQLTRLPRVIRGELSERVTEAHVAGFEVGFVAGQQAEAWRLRAEARDLRPALELPPANRPRKPRRLDCLREQVVDQELRARVVAALRVDDGPLDRVLEGRVQPSSTQWRRLRQALSG